MVVELRLQFHQDANGIDCQTENDENWQDVGDETADDSRRDNFFRSYIAVFLLRHFCLRVLLVSIDQYERNPDEKGDDPVTDDHVYDTFSRAEFTVAVRELDGEIPEDEMIQTFLSDTGPYFNYVLYALTEGGSVNTKAYGLVQGGREGLKLMRTQLHTQWSLL